MNKGVTLLKELQSSVSLLIEEADISFDDLKCNSRFLIHLFDKIPDYRSRCLVDYSLSSLLVISLVLIMKGGIQVLLLRFALCRGIQERFCQDGAYKGWQSPFPRHLQEDVHARGCQGDQKGNRK